MSKQKEFLCKGGCKALLHWSPDYRKDDPVLGRPLDEYDEVHECPNYRKQEEQPKPQQENDTRCPIFSLQTRDSWADCIKEQCAIFNQDLKQCGLINLR